MTSSINPNNIDTTYPIAGQDNDSQGFRDNFTNIKTNFEYAETEIDDLQAKGIFKSALTGTVLDNDMAGALVENMKIQGFRGTRIALGAVSAAGTATIDYNAGQYYTFTITTSATLAFSNIPSAGNAFWVNVRIVVSIGDTLTLPATVVGTSGIQGYVSNIITFNEAGTYEFLFQGDAGQSGSIYISELTRPRNKLVNPIQLAGSEDLAASGVASQTLTTSYFTTAGVEASTLAAGVEGQVKVLAAVDITAGDMVTTVADAGWVASGSGTITFGTIGDAVTLMYINSKWFCIGNNGGTFA